MRSKFLIPCILVLIVFGGCQDKKKPVQTKKDKAAIDKSVVATIDNEKITLNDYQRYMQELMLAYAQLRGTPEGEKKLDRLQKELLDDLISRRLMLKEAKRVHLEVSPVELKEQTQKVLDDYAEGTFEKNLRHEGLTLAQWQHHLEEELIIKKLISQQVEEHVEVTDTEIENYFHGHPDEFMRPERIRVRQIVLEDELEAENLWKQLRRGNNFAKLAETHSLGPDGTKGGDLGYFARGEMPAEFEEVAFSLKRTNEISKVFSTSYGYHIFQLVDRQKAHQATLGEVKQEIREKLHRQKVEARFQSWLATLKAQAKIKINPYFTKKN